MGNTFKYMQGAAAEFCTAQKDLASTIDRTMTVLKTLAGVGLGNVPAPNGVADITALTADTVGELSSKWAVKTGSEFDLTELAAKLAIVSDTLKTKSHEGLLVPGFDEVAALDYPADGSEDEENTHRLKNGLEFNEKYSEQLKKFKEHYLEESVKNESQALK